jgi:peptide/nickel transport system substrate-binding protein
MRRTRAWLLCCAPALAWPAAAQREAPDHGTITIVIGAEPTLPIPTLSNAKQNLDVASLLFLPLARLGPDLAVTDERRYEPALARAWARRDSVTLVFDLDPRARWHDGTPVTARDVVWSLDRARDSAVAPTHALLLRHIGSVAAEGTERVVVRFRRAYPEQMYDAVFHVHPLPAHLLDTIPPDRLARSSFVAHPIGNGPFRWSRAEPGRQVELVANADFFLGRPRLKRVVLLLARGAEAQLNLVLDGTADAYETAVIARTIAPVAAHPTLRIQTFPSLAAGYVLFNRTAYGDRSRPHPILADADLRRALRHAIDRQRLIRSVFGPYASLTDGPFGRASWVRRVAPAGPGFDLPRARALLARRGWRDSDGDGVLDRAGTPLALRLNYPATSVPRVALAEPIQEMLRQVGVRVELVRLDFPVWLERRNRGEFDLDFAQVLFDATPTGLVQSWSCGGIGGTNVAHICNPAFDSALARAGVERADPAAAWRGAIQALQDDAPAIFLYSPAQVVVLHARYRGASFRADAPWADLWRWSVDPARRIARDGGLGR